jgi:hypothetical protein
MPPAAGRSQAGRRQTRSAGAWLAGELGFLAPPARPVAEPGYRGLHDWLLWLIAALIGVGFIRVLYGMEDVARAPRRPRGGSGEVGGRRPSDLDLLRREQ